MKPFVILILCLLLTWPKTATSLVETSLLGRRKLALHRKFALPSYYSSGDPGNVEESASGASIERKPLREIFDSERHYLFTTKSNMRDYEWRKEIEVEDLFESLLSLEDHPIDTCPGYTVELNLINILQIS